jgi:hypothetical protein
MVSRTTLESSDKSPSARRIVLHIRTALGRLDV